MTDKLKPCPFCGGEAVLRYIKPHTHYIVDMPDYGGGAFIECTECTCGISAETEDGAIKAWNTRKPMDRIVEQLEENADYEPVDFDCGDVACTAIDYFIALDTAIEIVKGGAE